MTISSNHYVSMQRASLQPGSSFSQTAPALTRPQTHQAALNTSAAPDMQSIMTLMGDIYSTLSSLIQPKNLKNTHEIPSNNSRSLKTDKNPQDSSFDKKVSPFVIQ